MTKVFAAQVFFIVFREVLEAVIIVSVLLSFLKQSLGGPDQDPKIYKRLVRQVWFGSFLGIFVCLCIGGAFIGVFYGLGRDIWASSEDLWEGIFYLIATVIITIMGLALLRINKTKEKWRVKIAQALVAKAKHHDVARVWASGRDATPCSCSPSSRPCVRVLRPLSSSAVCRWVCLAPNSHCPSSPVSSLVSSSDT